LLAWKVKKIFYFLLLVKLRFFNFYLFIFVWKFLILDFVPFVIVLMCYNSLVDWMWRVKLDGYHAICYICFAYCWKLK
jgi:hypothetical protein